MIKNFTRKRNRRAIKIISFLTLIFSMAALQSMGQQIWEFDYTGNVQTLELPPGKYKFEAWGAEGANGFNTQGGRGGFAEGVINFGASTTAYIVVGGAGTNQTGGYNGGGDGGVDQSGQNGGAGGGATHIATSDGLLSTLAANLSSVKIVAGGGAGGGRDGDTGDAGGLSGLSSTIFNSGRPGTGGTQSEGGTAFITTRGAEHGSFGQGGSGSTGYNSAGGGGGGGGFYGGGGGTSTEDHGSGYSSGGGGGSSYIANLTEEQTIAGNTSMPDLQGGQMTGNTGNGFVRITQLYFVSLFNKTDASCPESADGAISAQINGGAAPYTFEWSNGFSSNSIDETELSENENLLPGEYSVTVTDANGAETTGVYVIGPDPLEVSFDMTQATSCDEISDGAATANVSGGTAPYTYSWNSGEDVASISNKGFGSYTVTVTDDNNCNPAIETVEITPSDDTDPVVEVKDIEVYLDSEGLATIDAGDVDNGSTDDCALADLSIDVSSFSCEDVGGDPNFDGNTAIAFDGEDDYLEFDQVIPYATSHTIAAWLKVAPNGSGTVFTWGSPQVNNTTGIRVWSNRIRYQATSGAGSTVNVESSPLFGDGEWHHLVAVRDGNQVDLYIDGSLDVSGTMNVSVSNPTSTSLGGGLINGIYQSHLDAEMDEFAYWPEALTSTEIQNIPCSGPQGAEVFLNFNSGAGTTSVADESGNGNAATLFQMDATSDWVNFGEPKELSFCPNGVKTTLSATDAAGNSALADAYVTVLDSISPTALARNQSIELDQNGNATAVAENFDDGSSDNCSIEGFAIDKSAFTCADLGLNDIVLTVSDIHGNSRSVATQVLVEDKLAPSLSVQNIEVALDAEGVASISTDDVEISSSDNCAVASKSLDIDTFSCEDLGEVTVEMTVADASGNERSESFTVTVVDDTAPVANPQPYTVQLDNDGLAEFTSADVEQFIGGADTDDCSGILDGSQAISQMQFSCEELGDNTVTYSVKDISGNEGLANVVITVVDNLPPQAAAQNLVIELDENGHASIGASDADNGSTDNCSIASRELSVTEFTCEDLGEQEVTLTVVDGSGNESDATFTVSVVDPVAPEIAENLSATVYLDAQGQGVFDTAPLLAQASDNCGLDAIVSEGDGEYTDINGFPFNCDEVGVSGGPLFVRDISGNLTAFNLQLSVVDTIKPELALELFEMQLDTDGNAVLNGDMLLPFATDNCGIADVTIEANTFDCTSIGETQYTEVVVIDIHGNEKVQTLGVVVEDVIAPEVQVQNISVELNANGQAVVSTDMLDMDVIENCTVNGMEIKQMNFSCEDLGENTNSITVHDMAGNSTEAGFTVTVVDQLAPTINGPLVLTSCAGSPISYADYAATDNCSATLAVIDGPEEGEVLTIGNYAVEFQAVDPSGNTTAFFAMLEVSPQAEVDLGDNMAVEEGTIVTLVAGEENGNSYLWSNGATGATYQFVATEDVVVSVEVTTPNGCVSSDEITIKIDSALSTVEDSEGNAIRFFPNPTRDQLSVEFSLNKTSEDLNLSIYDLSGKKVVEKMIPAAQSGEIVEIDLSEFARGIYLINILSDDFNLTERVVKQ